METKYTEADLTKYSKKDIIQLFLNQQLLIAKQG
jgi:hypothetical protein